MSDKTVRLLGATQEEVVDDSRRTVRTGRVRVHVGLEWLKNTPIAYASMTPSQARRFAIQVLEAAERVEAQR